MTENTTPPPEAPRAKRRWLRLALGLALTAGAGAGAYVWFGSGEGSKDRSAGAGGRAVPVVAARARRGDVDVHLTGLGTVTPFTTVTLHSRVDGELVKVAFVEGQLVHEGDLLVEIDPRPFQVQLMNAEGQRDRDQALLENAKIDLERYEAARDAVSKQQVWTQRALVLQYQGNLKTDEAQIESAKLQLTYCRITSPMTGVIGLRLVDQGNLVHASDQTGLAVVEQIKPISVIFTLPEDDLPIILRNPDKGARLPVEAYDRELRTKLASGAVLTLDNRVDPSTATIKIRAIFPNEDEALFPNQFVNARLHVDTRHDLVVVPQTAVQLGPKGFFVYLVRPDSTIELRDVVPGPTEGDETGLESGIAEGAVVVVEGLDKLQSGSSVTVRYREGPKARGVP
jgi:multidrug efflux system membrane fusion protein